MMHVYISSNKQKQDDIVNGFYSTKKQLFYYNLK